MSVVYAKVNVRIREMRERSGFTLKEVAKRLGVAEATAQRWESGEIRNIKQKHIAEMSKMFDCTPEYLSGWDDSPTEETEYPIIGRIPAGIPIEAVKDFEGTIEIPRAIIKRYGAESIFALRIKGDSMNKVISNGAIGIFCITDQADNGDVVAVSTNGDDVTLKRFLRVENLAILKPESYSEQHEIKTYDMAEEPNFRIVGKLVAAIKIFE